MAATPLFRDVFRELTGFDPMSWQTRLYEDCFVKDDLPAVIDISTGLGKTMVMAIWLIARRQLGKQIPTRLIYVVDRRTVVDQATDLAKKLQENYGKDKLAISTLRGQLADNRQWSADPSRPAIIIGTVDLIGSALLFSGYRSSYKRRPLEAGLLGQDSLLVLDEAHLSKPFEKLIRAIGDNDSHHGEDGRFQKNHDGSKQGKPMRVIRMSATSGDSTDSKPSFTLQFDANGNLTGDDAKDAILTERFHAKKRLTITTLGEKEKLTDKLANEAIKLAENNLLCGKRIVVFVRKPEDAKTIAKAIREHGSTKSKPGPFVESVEVLTGTMRGLERDELLEKPVLKRFLDGDENPGLEDNKQPVFLISTSAGEVGFDLNADHLVGDEAPLDSWIQRLGRVNRRGNGDATVILIKRKEPAAKTDFDKACTATSELLSDGIDVSPKALAAFKKSLAPEQIEQASAPKPATVELTDILLDAWSMTSIIEPTPGRPEVAPWLRGVADELPQTTIAWRIELDEPGFADLPLEDVEEWFDAHRVLTHETLTGPTSVVAKWFMDRWENLDYKQQSNIGSRSIIVDRSGLQLVTVNDVIQQLTRKNTDSIRDAELILPASFGGIERGIGLLDATAPTQPDDAKEVDRQVRQANAGARRFAPDVADAAKDLQRQRQIVSMTEDSEPEPRIIGGGTKPAKLARFVIELASGNEQIVRLVSYVPRRDKLEWGTIRQYLHNTGNNRGHVECVGHCSCLILKQLGMRCDGPVCQAVKLAAAWHDHGKDRERWQRCADRKPDEPPLGKSGGRMRRDFRGYRHEFGSLREFTDACRAGEVLDDGGKLISQDVIDLAAHLIATHHGRGRPYFPRGGFDPDCESRSDEIHADAIRRFARLQRKYGWWQLAWLENLLRCADAMASADPTTGDAVEQSHVAVMKGGTK